MSRDTNVNLDNLLAVMLLELRKHLNQCRLCKVALEANDYDMICVHTKRLIVSIGRRWDRNIPGRLAAKRGKRAVIYPCPDTSKHGQAYALAAEAVYIDAVQPALY